MPLEASTRVQVLVIQKRADYNITTMQNNFKYINLSWAVVGICENARQPLLSCIPGIDNDEAAAVEHYVIGYMAFWHIAFVDDASCPATTTRSALRPDRR